MIPDDGGGLRAVWSNSAILWHAHSQLWFGVMLGTATYACRGIEGATLGNLTALLFALDHTHAYLVGLLSMELPWWTLKSQRADPVLGPTA
jgi:hypothetical protein